MADAVRIIYTMPDGAIGTTSWAESEKRALSYVPAEAGPRIAYDRIKAELAIDDILETIVDQYGLTPVLASLSRIAYAKADHIAANWQDGKTAWAWTKAGRFLYNALVKIEWPS